jgi:GT2 family glycosyltransferase
MLRLSQWSGIPFARNRGADVARHPIYLITDGNTRYPINWDLPIRRHFHPSRVVAATIADIASQFRGYGCTLLLPSMGASWIPQPGFYGGYVPVAACTATVIDRSLFHHLGGYDESLPLYGAAEPEFSVRAWLSGYEVINIPDLLVTHRFRPRAEHDLYLRSNGPLLRRNYLRFAAYYLPESLLHRTYEYYAAQAPGEFDTRLAELEASGVWAHRAHLRRRLPRDFDWLNRRFALSPPEHHAGRDCHHLS